MTIANRVDQMKDAVKALFDRRVDELFARSSTEPFDQRHSERSVWAVSLEVGRQLLSTLWSDAACRETENTLQQRGWSHVDVQVRSGGEYAPTTTTTFGPVSFQLFAFRRRGLQGGRVTYGRTEVPSLSLFPLHQKCASSPLCLEWETRLGADLPFRLAQEELQFFTHGAVSVEDNTICRHLVGASGLLDRRWLYRTPCEIRQILQDRAMRDVETGKPVVFLSSDAHALKRYVDETWNAPWKMANGIRIWTIDAATGETIHLGGEFTWGDCHHVGQIFQELISSGVLPHGGDYGDGLVALYSWVSDGMPWFEDHILPLFDESSVVIVIDAYHLLERMADYAKAVFGKTSSEARAWCERVREVVLGPREAKPGTKNSPKRKGHIKTKRTKPAAPQVSRDASESTPSPAPGQTPLRLLNLIAETEQRANNTEHADELEALLEYVFKNAYRMDYESYRHRGLQIGSGAMESVHRSGSQGRLKGPGTRWLAETAQAVFNWRMLKLVGRWEDFWLRADLLQDLAANWGTCCIDYELKEAAA